mmetsp:Transcript_411/g.1488  ORF Transcript_411/g.1488 Transcript_411/m.1488 type:complete len:207 (+) Transcript_411:38-658(+)
MTDFVKNLLGGSPPSAPAETSSITDIRAVNRDWMELGCDQKKESLACKNLVKAMARLGLDTVAAPEDASPEYVLGPAKVTSKPPTLVLRTDAEKRATCVKRCGVFGSVLASTLATTALSSPTVADLGVPDSQRELVAQAGGAAAAVVSVALCSRLCEPGKTQKTFDADGQFIVKGQYTYVAKDKSDLSAFQAYVKDHTNAPDTNAK